MPKRLLFGLVFCTLFGFLAGIYAPQIGFAISTCPGDTVYTWEANGGGAAGIGCTGQLCSQPGSGCQCFWVDANGDAWNGTRTTCLAPLVSSAGPPTPGPGGIPIGTQWVDGCRNADGSCVSGTSGGSCSGSCTWRSTVNCTGWDTVWSPCSQSGCTCAPPDHPPTGCDVGYRVVDYGSCTGSSAPSCSGQSTWCAYTVQGTGQVAWSWCDGSCSAGCFPQCPPSPPSQPGDQYITNCGSTQTGACPVKPGTCSGGCSYNSVQDGNGGYKWQLNPASDCGGYDSNGNKCYCPDNPGGPCPNAAGQTTTAACGGADGGNCTQNTQKDCTGKCTWKWSQANSGGSGTPGGTGTGCGTTSQWVAVQQGTAWVWQQSSGGDCTGTATPPTRDPVEGASAQGGCTCGDGQGNSGEWSLVSQTCKGSDPQSCGCSPPTVDGTTDGQLMDTDCGPVSGQNKCECDFSLSKNLGILQQLLNNRLGLFWPRGIDTTNPCTSFSFNLPNGTMGPYTICASYPNPTNSLESAYETARQFVRVIATFYMYWLFVSYVFNTFLFS